MSETPRNRLKIPPLRVLFGILVAVTIVFVLESHAPGGDGAWFGAFSFALLVLPFLALWLIYSLFVLLRHPDRRRKQWISISYAIVLAGIVVGGLSTAAGCFVIAEFTKRRAIAERLIVSVEIYKKQHGHYPKTMAEAGLTTGRAFQDWGLYYSELSSGRHEVSYLGPVPFSWYDYSFENHHWKLQLD